MCNGFLHCSILWSVQPSTDQNAVHILLRQIPNRICPNVSPSTWRIPLGLKIVFSDNREYHQNFIFDAHIITLRIISDRSIISCVSLHPTFNILIYTQMHSCVSSSMSMLSTVTSIFSENIRLFSAFRIFLCNAAHQ